MRIYENGKNWVIEDQLNEKLVEKINNLIDENLNGLLKFDLEGYSTTGKNAEQYWLIKSNEFYFKNKNFEDIKIDYKSQILNMLKKSNILNEEIQEKINLIDENCWSVIGEENSYHTPHYHNGTGYGISTLAYLKVPKTNVEDEPENNLYLIMNSGINTQFYHHNPKFIEINPVVGKLLIFPDWIIHGTYPQSKGIRQTFNIDYRVTLERKNKKNLKYNLNYA